jgi:hypothetical protein
MTSDKPSIVSLPDDVANPDEDSTTTVAVELDADEAEFRAMRRDLPGAKGASSAGMVTIAVGKLPGKNEFFRTRADFHPIVSMVNIEVGMEKQFFVVASNMIEPLSSIGITVADYRLYLTVGARGAVKVVPVRQANSDGEQNEYDRTKEIGLNDGVVGWVRLYTDLENRCYRVYPAPVDRFADPIWPELPDAKIFKLAFRDKGHLLDSTEHPLFKKWAARDSD